MRGVALGVSTLLFLVGGSVGSAVVGGLGEVHRRRRQPRRCSPCCPLLGLVVLAPQLRRGVADVPLEPGADEAA